MGGSALAPSQKQATDPPPTPDEATGAGISERRTDGRTKKRLFLFLKPSFLLSFPRCCCPIQSSSSRVHVRGSVESTSTHTYSTHARRHRNFAKKRERRSRARLLLLREVRICESGSGGRKESYYYSLSSEKGSSGEIPVECGALLPRSSVYLERERCVRSLSAKRTGRNGGGGRRTRLWPRKNCADEGKRESACGEPGCARLCPAIPFFLREKKGAQIFVTVISPSLPPSR